jgi:Terpene synthase family 2, C-terminal metal binding
MPQRPIPIDFTYQPNPDMARAQARIREWGRRYGVDQSEVTWKRFRATESCRLACYAYRHAKGADLDLAVDTVSTIFLVEEVFDSGALWTDPHRCAEFVKQMTAILNEPSVVPPGSGLLEAFADLWRRSTTGMSTRWQVRAAQSWMRYLWGNVAEAVDRVRELALTLDSYLVARHGPIGFMPCMDMIERASGYEIPDRVWQLTDVQRLRELGCDVITLCNDVASFEKEMERGEPNNAVVLLMAAEGIRVEEALARVVDKTVQVCDEFQRVRERLTQTCELLRLNPDERRIMQLWVDDVENWLGANVGWQSVTPRYKPGAGRVLPDAEHSAALIV